MVVTHERKMTEVGVIPEDWAVMMVGDLSKLSSGTTPARAMQDRYFNNGTIPWVKTLDLNNAEIYSTDECVTTIAIEETSLIPYPVGTVLVAMYGGFAQIGRTGLLRIPATVNQALTAIQTDRRRLSPDFLLNVLNFGVEYWKKVASSSRKDPNITSGDIRAFPLGMPPTLAEQEAIATALSDADGLIASLEQLGAKKQQIKHGAMQELLTGRKRLPGFTGEWETKPFDSVIRRLNAKDYQIQTARYQSTGRYPVVDQGKHQIVAYSDQANRVFPCPTGGVIVFGDHTCIFKFVDFDFVVGADGVQLLQAKAPHLTAFQSMQLQVNGIVPTGYNRHYGQLRQLRLSTPSPDEQSAIAAILSDLDAEIAALEAKLAKARRVKQGMAQELLTGRIRVV